MDARGLRAGASEMTEIEKKVKIGHPNDSVWRKYSSHSAILLVVGLGLLYKA